MANPISRWLQGFSGPKEEGPDSEDLEARLATLEREVERAVSGYRGTPLNQAGDLCIKAGDRERALGYYGRAIDAFLEDEQLESARGVALKLVRLHPQAVRTLCTLTWLDLASGHSADALTHLEQYVDGVLRDGGGDLATTQIRRMAGVVSDPKLRSAMADALERLGASETADEVRSLEDGGAVSEEELRELCFRAALRSGRG